MDAFDASVDFRIFDHRRDARADFFFHILQKFQPRACHVVQRFFNVCIRYGVKKADCQIFEFFLGGADTETVCNRRIDFNGFQRNIPLFLRRHKIEGPHVVESVRKLDDNDADILIHRQQHFSQVFRLKFLFGGKRHLAELGNAVHKRGNLAAEFRLQLGEGNVGILYRVVQKRGFNGLRVHAEIHQNIGDGNRVNDVRLPGIAKLCAVHILS